MLLCLARQVQPAADVLAVDLGTGSGVIALSLAVERDALAVIATDRDPAALEVAVVNLGRIPAGAAARVKFFQGDWYQALPVDLAGQVNLIVANPPYIAEHEWAGLDPQVRGFDPLGHSWPAERARGDPGDRGRRCVMARAAPRRTCRRDRARPRRQRRSPWREPQAFRGRVSSRTWRGAARGSWPNHEPAGARTRSRQPWRPGRSLRSRPTRFMDSRSTPACRAQSTGCSTPFKKRPELLPLPGA